MRSEYYITDTHAFLWYLADSPKFSRKARAIFDLCDQGEVKIIISAVVLLECIDIFDKKKILLDFESIANRIIQSDNFIFSEIDWGLILEVNELKGFKDLHDRVIVAAAKIYGGYLISKDQNIKLQYPKTIW